MLAEIDHRFPSNTHAPRGRGPIALQALLDAFGERLEVAHALHLVVRKLDAEVVLQARQQLESLQAARLDAEEIERRMAAWVADNPAPRGNLGDVADHIEHIVAVAGIDHVGLGSDYYDAGESSMAYGLEDVTRFPYLIAELLDRGWSDEDVKKLAGLNVLRAMRAMEATAERLRAERDPSMARVQ